MKKTPFPLIPQANDNFYLQKYGGAVQIQDVKLIDLPHINNEEGDFSEVLRLTEEGTLERFPHFKLRQINRTELFPGSIKAWHFHFRQDEIWYTGPNNHIVVGLWDVRKDSPTSGQSTKIILGNGNRNMLYIPKGVAHGSINTSLRPLNLFYFVDQQFNIENPDEQRIHWDTLGADFWKPERD